jgi:hypothetical protein
VQVSLTIAKDPAAETIIMISQSIIAGDFVERARDCPFDWVLMSRLSALTRLTTDRDGRLAPQIFFCSFAKDSRTLVSAASYAAHV